MSKLAKALTAAAGNAGGDNLYVEDVFSTYLYNGVPLDTPKTITNGIDLAGEGGLVWTKRRSNARSHVLFDSERSNNAPLYSDLTNAEGSEPYTITMNSDGYTWSKADNDTSYGESDTFVGWTFRKKEKFFDIVTYTGNDVSGREIAHNLGSTPAVIIVKKTSGTYNWQIYHSSLGATKFLEFNTGASQTSSAVWNDTAPTDAVFTVGNEYGVNQSGDTYVAYLFASDAGGFGDDGDESIIKCGSYVEPNNGSFTDVDLGFEPQFIIAKCSSSGGSNWVMSDSMRGMPVGDGAEILSPNTNAAESAGFANAYFRPTATGFSAGNTFVGGGGQTVIYIAIRRPMKTPESGTEVFAPVNRTATAPTYYTGFVTDMQIMTLRNGFQNQLTDRLRGQKKLLTNATDAESAIGTEATYDWMTGVGNQDSASSNNIAWNFKRATGFFDVVAYTGDGTTEHQITHNLGVTPEMIIVKRRSAVDDWLVCHKDQPDLGDGTQYNGRLNSNSSFAFTASNPSVAYFGIPTTGLTSTYFTTGALADVNASGSTYISYLFATLAGVSKVGSYTGNGTSQTIDCGFSGGARFILIKRIDSTGDWYVWDSVRGIVAGNDPHLSLNTTAAEVTTDDSIDPDSSGFIVNQVAATNINVSSASYIYLSIA
jgi:hypothetical protein